MEIHNAGGGIYGIAVEGEVNSSDAFCGIQGPEKKAKRERQHQWKSSGPPENDKQPASPTMLADGSTTQTGTWCKSGEP